MRTESAPIFKIDAAQCFIIATDRSSDTGSIAIMDLGADLERPRGAGYRDSLMSRRGSAAYVGSCVGLAMLIFIIDAFTMLGSAVAVLYVIVIVMASELGGSSVIRRVSTLCGVATIAAFGVVHGPQPDAQSLLRLVFSLAANVVTTAVLLRREVEIANREAAEKSLNASERRYRVIFETLAVAIWEHDFTEVQRELKTLRTRGVSDVRQYIADHPDFVKSARRLVRITNVNQTALTLLGVATKVEFFAKLDDFLWDMDQSFAQCLIAIDEGRTTFQAETKLRDRSGRLIPVIVALNFPERGQSLERIQGSVVDITERHSFQEAIEASRRELEQASRAAMVGEISASIAHEVNQPLSATMNYLQAALRWLDREEPDLDEARQAIERALGSTEHSADVVRRVRMLLGKAKPDSVEVDMEATILDAVRMKRADLSAHSTRLSLSLSQERPRIQGDRVLQQQAMLNIITNAMQAMDGVDPADRRLIVECRPGAADLVIRISDSGTGLRDHTGENLFRAFNTTKENGMGLGLAMCRSIIAAHGGSISIADRDEARGAVVEIRLPLTAPASAA
jgi:C4-dicarboxylate-specific signal transduction histidine kinase